MQVFYQIKTDTTCSLINRKAGASTIPALVDFLVLLKGLMEHLKPHAIFPSRTAD